MDSFHFVPTMSIPCMTMAAGQSMQGLAAQISAARQPTGESLHQYRARDQTARSRCPPPVVATIPIAEASLNQRVDRHLRKNARVLLIPTCSLAHITESTVDPNTTRTALGMHTRPTHHGSYMPSLRLSTKAWV